MDPLCPGPPGVDISEVIPVAPYSSDASAFLSLPWVNRRDAAKLAVTTKPGGERGKIRLRTYRDVLAEYGLHPEQQSGDPAGGPGVRGSRGLLPRLRVIALGPPAHIGKESNRLEVEEGGVLTDGDDDYVEYRDERREWDAILPKLQAIGVAELARRTGMSERTLRSRLNSGRLPREPTRGELIAPGGRQQRNARPSIGEPRLT